MDEITVDKLNYSGLSLFFAHNKLESFKVTDNTHSIKLDGLAIRIGENISSIENKFRSSFALRKDGNAIINLNEGDFRFILIEYNMYSGIITGIELRYY